MTSALQARSVTSPSTSSTQSATFPHCNHRDNDKEIQLSENNSQRANTQIMTTSNISVTSPTSNSNSSNNSNNNMTKSQMSSTPVRSNYAAPHTPIASAKRPRNPNRSSVGNGTNNSNGYSNTNGTKLNSRQSSSTPPPPSSTTEDYTITPQRFRSIPEVTALSPMHPVRPMHSHEEGGPATASTTLTGDGETNDDSTDAKVSSTWGALFSPVLNFLQPNEEDPTTTMTAPASDTTHEPTVSIKRENYEDSDVLYDDDGDVSMDMDHDVTALEKHSTLQGHDPEPQEQHSGSSQDDCKNSREDTEHYNNHNQVQADAHTGYDDSDHDNDEDSIDEEEEEFNPYLFIKRLPLYSTVCPTEQCAHLPPKSPHAPRQTLVLDLDETLVHCTVEPNTLNADMVFPVVFNGMEYQVHVKKRPYLEEFLSRVYREFEVVVFTASQRVYADELLNRIDPDNKYIKHRMFRESCLPVEGNYLKDLNVLGRDLRTAVLVDNSPHAFGYQVDNGIPIESWFEDPNDTELLKLEKFLRTLKGHKDVRPLVRAKFMTHELIRDA